NELFSNFTLPRVSRSLVTLAKSNIKKILALVEFDEKIIASAESDKKIIALAKSNKEEIQILAESDMEEMFNIEEIFGVEEISEIKISDIEEIMFNTDKVFYKL
ncbi:28110_t:CDS:1, partial [Racocetra persica]